MANADFSVVKEKIIKTDEILTLHMTLKNQMKKVQSAYKQTKSDYEQSCSETNRLKLDNERLTFNLKSLKNELDIFDKENKELRQQCAQLEETYNKMIIQNQLRCSELETELNLFKLETNSKSPKAKSPKAKVNDRTVNKRIKELEKECNRLKQTNIESYKRIAKLVIDNKKVSDDKYEEITLLHSENEKLKSEVETLKCQVQKNAEELSKYQKDELDIKLANTLLKEDNATLIGEVQTLKFQVEKHSTEISNYNLNSRNEFNNKSSNLSNELQQKETEIKDLNKKLNVLHQEVMKINEEKIEDKLKVTRKSLEVQTENCNVNLDLSLDFNQPNIGTLDNLPTVANTCDDCSLDEENLNNVLKEMKYLPQIVSPLRISVDNDDAKDKNESPFNLPSIIVTPPTPVIKNISEIEDSFEAVSNNNKSESLQPAIESKQDDNMKEKQRKLPKTRPKRRIYRKYMSSSRKPVQERIIKRKNMQRKLGKSTVLDAILTLKNSNINFTISNGVNPVPCPQYNWLNNYPVAPTPANKFNPMTIEKYQNNDKYFTENLSCCRQTCQDSVYMLLKIENETQLLGFFDVKEEVITPASSRLDCPIDYKHFDSQIDSFSRGLRASDTVLETLAELVSEKLKEKNCLVKTRPKVKRKVDSCTFYSETESELERLFDKDKFKRRKRRKYGRNQNDTLSKSSIDSSDSSLENSLDASTQDPSPSNNTGNLRNEMEQTETAISSPETEIRIKQLSSCPNLLSPMSNSMNSFKETPPRRVSPRKKTFNKRLSNDFELDTGKRQFVDKQKTLETESSLKKISSDYLIGRLFGYPETCGSPLKDTIIPLETGKVSLKKQLESTDKALINSDLGNKPSTTNELDKMSNKDKIHSILKTRRSPRNLQKPVYNIGMQSINSNTDKTVRSYSNYNKNISNSTAYKRETTDLIKDSVQDEEVRLKTSSICKYPTEDSHDNGSNSTYSSINKVDTIKANRNKKINIVQNIIIPAHNNNDFFDLNQIEFPVSDNFINVQSEDIISTIEEEPAAVLNSSEDCFGENVALDSYLPKQSPFESIDSCPEPPKQEETVFKVPKIPPKIYECLDLSIKNKRVAHMRKINEKKTLTPKKTEETLCNFDLIPELDNGSKSILTDVPYLGIKSAIENNPTAVSQNQEVCPDKNMFRSAEVTNYSLKHTEDDEVPHSPTQKELQAIEADKAVFSCAGPSKQDETIFMTPEVPTMNFENYKTTIKKKRVAHTPKINQTKNTEKTFIQKAKNNEDILCEDTIQQPNEISPILNILNVQDRPEPDNCPKSPELEPLDEIECQPPKIIPLEKPQKLPTSKVKVLFEKLLIYSNEEKVLDEVVGYFLNQPVNYICECILSRISLDTFDKVDTKFTPPAPLLTEAQRVFLGLMSRLEKNNIPDVFDSFLRQAELKLFLSSELLEVTPITRLYLAICKLRNDLNRIRRFCCEAFYFMGDLAVPMFFVVLTSWIEVIPKADDCENYPLTKVLVQLVLLKDCNNPGYNLTPLRGLLNQYYGYPKERWSCDEMFQELLANYLRNPVRLSDFALLIFCKNHPTKWVYNKFKETFMAMVSKIPNENFKATVIILVGNVCSSFNAKIKYDFDVLLEVRQWLLSLVDDSTPDLVKRSVYLSVRRLKCGKNKF